VQTPSERQQSAADRLKVPLEFENTIGMKFVLIPAGEFTMGTSDSELEKVLALRGLHSRGFAQRERPSRQVRIAKPFYCGIHEVTRAEFAKFVEWTGYKTDAERDGKGSPPSFGPREGVPTKKSVRGRPNGSTPAAPARRRWDTPAMIQVRLRKPATPTFKETASW
jgi:formylglycine-generating enzyme required for sulfatase activity